MFRMTLSKLEEVHWGKLVVTVFRSTVNENRFLALDKIEKGLRVRGPLLSERDISGIASLIRRRSQSRFAHRATMFAKPAHTPNQDLCDAKPEIEGAIRKAQQKQFGNGSITVLPTMPVWRYLHTCSVCGCHVQSTLRMGATDLRLCSGCGYVDSVHTLGTREA